MDLLTKEECLPIGLAGPVRLRIALDLHDDLGSRFFDVVDGFFPGDEVFQGDAVHAEFEDYNE